MRFGARQREAREALHLSMSELARRMEGQGWKSYHAATVSRTEAGERTPRLDEAVDLARMLSTSVDYLAGIESAQAEKVREVQAATHKVEAAADAMRHAVVEFLTSRNESHLAKRGLAQPVDRGADLERALYVHEVKLLKSSWDLIIESAVGEWLESEKGELCFKALEELLREIDYLNTSEVTEKIDYLINKDSSDIWRSAFITPGDLWATMTSPLEENWRDAAEGQIINNIATGHGLP